MEANEQPETVYEMSARWDRERRENTVFTSCTRCGSPVGYKRDMDVSQVKEFLCVNCWRGSILPNVAPVT